MLRNGEGFVNETQFNRELTDYFNNLETKVNHLMYSLSTTSDNIDKEFWINENFKDGDGSKNSPFKSIKNVINIMPLIINYNIKINIESDITESSFDLLNINMMADKKFIIDFKGHNVKQIIINNCHASDAEYGIHLKNYKVNDITFVINSNNIKLMNVEHMKPTEISLYTNSSSVFLENYNFGNELVVKGIRADLNSMVYCYNNSGICKEYGIVSKRNSSVTQEGTSIVEGKINDEVFAEIS